MGKIGELVDDSEDDRLAVDMREAFDEVHASVQAAAVASQLDGGAQICFASEPRACRRAPEPSSWRPGYRNLLQGGEAYV